MTSGYAAIVMDVVGSRRHPDRALLKDTLRLIGGATPTLLIPMQFTLGDEVQAVATSGNDALRAVLDARLFLQTRAGADFRAGIGWGRIDQVEDATSAIGQDGPAWWVAREALDAVKASEQQRAGPRTRRVGLRYAAPSPQANTIDHEGVAPANGWPDPQHVTEAAIATLHRAAGPHDEVVGRMDARDLRLLQDLLHGVPRAETAKAEGISPSAIAQRLHRSGAFAIQEFHTEPGAHR